LINRREKEKLVSMKVEKEKEEKKRKEKRKIFSYPSIRSKNKILLFERSKEDIFTFWLIFPGSLC